MDTSLDISNFYQTLKEFPNQFAKSVDVVSHVKLQGSQYDSIAICGMGGSAMPYNLLQAYFAYKKITVPLYQSRSYSLPYQATENTLVIISSYSGNTEEALSCLEEAHERGFDIVGFSAGGAIEQKASEYGFQYAKYPEEHETFQPRNAIGYSFSSMLFMLMNAGIVPENVEEITALGPFLSSLTIEEEAKGIAQEMEGKIPVVFTDDMYQDSAGRIVKIKFNENSKMPSFFNSFPELNHNEMVGYTLMTDAFFFVFFKDEASHERIIKRMKITQDILEDKGAQVRFVLMQGQTMLEKMFSAIHFGDYMTYYRALINGIDPTPVDMVEDFKKKLVQ